MFKKEMLEKLIQEVDQSGSNEQVLAKIELLKSQIMQSVATIKNLNIPGMQQAFLEMQEAMEILNKKCSIPKESINHVQTVEEKTQINEINNSSNKRHIEFGSYPQTANGGIEKIRWRVLETKNGLSLLLSEFILESRYWVDKENNIPKTWKNEDILKAMIPWKDNYLRRYLNSEFYDKAFNANEKKKIVKRLNKGNGAYLHHDYVPKKQHKQNINILIDDTYEKYEERGCGDTEDFVFLLSIEEAITYFDKNYTVPNTIWPANDDRKAKPTAFVRAKGTFDPKENKYLGGYSDKKAMYYRGKDCIVIEEFTGCMDWFLRSVGANDITYILANAPSHHGQLSYITYLGAIHAGGVFPKALNFGIRPAILINE